MARETTGECADTLRVMSFNVRYGAADDGANAWRHRRESCLEAIRAFGPDLLGVQEALAFQVDELREALDLAVIGVGRDDGMREGEFAAIFYNPRKLHSVRNGSFWFSPTPEAAGSRFPGCHHPRICTWTESAQFIAYNLHLDNESEAAREAAVRLLLERMPSQGSVLVMGDFNEGEAGTCARMLRDAGFRDTYRCIHREGSAGTYHGFGAVEAREKIDAVWVRGDWDVLQASIEREAPGGIWPSDHYPVTAVVSRPAEVRAIGTGRRR